MLRFDEESDQMYLLDRRKVFNITQGGQIVDAFGAVVRDGSVFSFPWPQWAPNESRKAKMGILQQFELSGLLPDQRPP